MATAKSWIKAARLRTLPLAISGILMGCGLAAFYGDLNSTIAILAITTAVLIQVFSNFANDYGDGKKGTDNEFRLGPQRTIQSGEISPSEMKKGMLIIGGISFILGLTMVYLATWKLSKTSFFVFVALGILALLAAYFYTAGKRSYGYVGLGDLAVFLFFGPLPVVGAYFLVTGGLNTNVILPAISIGFFSTGVLNLNNMRDIENDARSGKTTVPVRIGSKWSKYYHAFLIWGGLICTLAFAVTQFQLWWNWIFLLIYPFFITDLIQIQKVAAPKDFDPFLKRLALSTLGLTLIFCLIFILSVS